MTGAGTQKPIGISFPKGTMVEESASSVPVPLLCLTSKICAEHYWSGAGRRAQGAPRPHFLGVLHQRADLVRRKKIRPGTTARGDECPVGHFRLGYRRP